MPTNSLKPPALTPGQVIAIRHPLFKHFAIVSDCFDNDTPRLISLSYRKSSVQEERWQDVVGNRQFEISNIEGHYSREIILARARRYLSCDIKYNLITFNCEHFARLIHGLPVESVQVKHAVYGAIFGAASCALLPNITLARLAIATSTGAATALKTSLRKL